VRKTGKYGYYLFLGLGDFEQSSTPERAMDAPTILGADWTQTWDLSEWQKRLDRLVHLGSSTIFIYLMGHKLPYRSRSFPECVETGHPNVSDEFLQNVLDLASERKIEVVAVFSTTGHAKGYVSANPHLAIQDRTGTPQVSKGIMCHSQQEAQQYPLMIIREVLTRYRGFVGAMLHPPEFLKPCFCMSCQERYLELCGTDLLSASDEEAVRFFMETNLSFQKSVLEKEVKQRIPEAQLFIASIPWVFEPHFDKIADHIDGSTVIIEWDYNLSEDRIKDLPERLKKYRQFGHNVWFMPTSGFAFSKTKTQKEQVTAVLS
jgi:hypothetical protein